MMKIILLISVVVLSSSIAKQIPHIDWSAVDLVNQPNADASIVRERRIHNGEVVQPHSIPYQAGLLTRHSETMVGRWGGSLITKRSVLAAAHSLFTPLIEVVVVLGAHYITRLEDSQQRFYMNLEQIHRHPDFGHRNDQFNHGRNPNDLAILVLPREAVLNEYVNVVRLPTGAEINELFTAEWATVSGFGRPAPGESWTDDLRSTTNRIITNSACQGLLPTFTIHSTDMCAENTGAGSSCGGDCGGPVTITRGGERIQIGLVPMGPPCDQGFPDLFVRVAPFLPWIRENAP